MKREGSGVVLIEGTGDYFLSLVSLAVSFLSFCFSSFCFLCSTFWKNMRCCQGSLS